MKKIILSTILFAFAFTFASAQVLTLADTALVITGVATDDEGGVYVEMTNNTSEILDLRWQRVEMNQPDEWDSWVCTVPGLCGLPDTDLLTFELGADSVGEFQYHAAPNDVGGVGTYKVIIVNNANSETLETITITADFSTVSANEIEKAQIKMFPNPTSDHFQLSNNEIIDQVVIYNILGKQVKTFGANVQSYFVGDLPKGLYMVQLNDEDSDSTKTLKLKKN